MRGDLASPGQRVFTATGADNQDFHDVWHKSLPIDRLNYSSITALV
jgi:hypothetical protein